MYRKTLSIFFRQLIRQQSSGLRVKKVRKQGIAPKLKLATEQLRIERLPGRKPCPGAVHTRYVWYLTSRLLDRLDLTLVGHEAGVWRADIILPIDA